MVMLRRRAGADEHREKVHIMVEFLALDLVRQQRQGLDRRVAERARLAREARPRKRRGDRGSE